MNEEGLAGDHIVLTSHKTLFSEPGWEWWRCLTRCSFSFIAGLFLVGFVGCIVIPTPEHALLEGRGEIDESDIAFLAVSKTTREEVLLRFGEPDLVLNDQRILIYHWTVSHGYFFVGGGYSGAGGAIPKGYLFMLEFDGKGSLKRFEINGSIWTPKKYRIDKWTPPTSEKLSRQSRQNIFIDPIPTPYAQAISLDTEFRPIRFRVGEFCDGRTSPHTDNFIGHNNTAFGVISADVLTIRPAIELVRAAVACQLEVLGHQFASKDADVTITGKIAEFGVTTSFKLSTWDATGFLDVIMEVQHAAETNAKILRHYKAKHVLRTRSTPSKANLEQVMRTCLEDMQKQIASDAELARLLGGRTQ